MKLYGAIDLHSTNNVTVVINEQDHVVYQLSREPRVGPSCPIQPQPNKTIRKPDHLSPAISQIINRASKLQPICRLRFCP